MLNHEPVNKPDLKAWQAEILRTTCFLSSATQLGTKDWWHELIGKQPENRILRLKESLQQDEGHIDGVKLILGIRPMRIDWIAVPNEDQDRFWIGPFQDSLNLFLDLMLRWLKVGPPLKRLAFGAVLMLPVDDQKSGYAMIAKYLSHIKIDSEGSSDFFYQINRRRDSKVEVHDLKINRLSKWGVAKRGIGQIDLSPDIARINFFPASESYVCRLELDINTIAEYQNDLPREQLDNIFQELVDLGKEIAINGDIP